MNGALGAVVWGAIAASSLLIGAVLALRARPSDRIVGLVLAFGAGTLISAVAYELVPEEAVDAVGVGIALGLGALTFFLGDAYVSRMGGENRKDLDADEAPSSGSGGAIVLGTILAAGSAPGSIYRIWLGIVAFSAVAAGAGYVVASAIGASDELVQAFASRGIGDVPGRSRRGRFTSPLLMRVVPR